MRIYLFVLFIAIIPSLSWSQSNPKDESHWVAVKAKDKAVRTWLVNQGLSIETVVDDMSYGYAPLSIVEELIKKGADIKSHFPIKEFSDLAFPPADSVYHDYARTTATLDEFEKSYPNLAHRFTIGKTTEGREMRGIRLNSHAKNAEESSGLPGIVFMGGHHAREHLSIEMPLLLAKHLLENYGKDATITTLLDHRDIYIIPMINPDGAEFDISTGDYQMWRKNRKPTNDATCPGVDLNRNYGFGWGTGGSSTNPCSEVYMGPSAFSEPETQNVKKFVEDHHNLKILLSFHTYSELILYPWGGKYDPITDQRDLGAFKTMADTMAKWNGYTPEQASELYIASGDTTDWAYGTQKIFAFTFELSPKNMWGGGGFYPGPGAIDSTFQANLKPALYLIDLADNPYRASIRPETTLFYGIP